MTNNKYWLRGREAFIETGNRFTLKEAPSVPDGPKPVGILFQHRTDEGKFEMRFRDAGGGVWWRPGRYDGEKFTYDAGSSWALFGSAGKNGLDAQYRRELLLESLKKHLEGLGRPASRREVRLFLQPEYVNRFGFSENSAAVGTQGIFTLIEGNGARDLVWVNPDEPKLQKREYAFQPGANYSLNNAPLYGFLIGFNAKQEEKSI